MTPREAHLLAVLEATLDALAARIKGTEPTELETRVIDAALAAIGSLRLPTRGSSGEPGAPA
jgi:hypothetical protein